MKRALTKTDIKNAPKKTRSKKYPIWEAPTVDVPNPENKKPAVKTRWKKAWSSRKDESWLTDLQRLFCKIYAQDLEYMGNWVYAYSQAFWISIEEKWWYATCASWAHRLLKQSHVLSEIKKLMDLTMNEVMADRELAFLVTQHSDLSVKRAALRDWNELNWRIKQKIEQRNVDKEWNDVPVGPPIINVRVVTRQVDNPSTP